MLPSSFKSARTNALEFADRLLEVSPSPLDLNTESYYSSVSSSILLVRNRRQPPSDSLVKPPEVPASFCQHEPNDNHLTRLSTLATMLSHSLIVSAIFAAIVVAGTVPGSPVACPDVGRLCCSTAAPGRTDTLTISLGQTRCHPARRSQPQSLL